MSTDAYTTSVQSGVYNCIIIPYPIPKTNRIESRYSLIFSFFLPPDFCIELLPGGKNINITNSQAHQYSFKNRWAKKWSTHTLHKHTIILLLCYSNFMGRVQLCEVLVCILRITSVLQNRATGKLGYSSAVFSTFMEYKPIRYLPGILKRFVINVKQAEAFINTPVIKA